MDAPLTILATLKKARALVRAGRYANIIAAVSSLTGEASAATRDSVYFALLETAVAAERDESLEALSRPEDGAVALIDATIARLTAKLH